MKDFNNPNDLIPPILEYVIYLSHQRDFLKALQRAKPTVSPEDLIKHKKFTDEFGMDG